MRQRLQKIFHHVNMCSLCNLKASPPDLTFIMTHRSVKGGLVAIDLN